MPGTLLINYILIYELKSIRKHPEWVSESCSVSADSLRLHGLYSPWNSPGQNIRVRSHSLLQGIFPTQGSNPGLLHCRQILYQLSHKGTPKKMSQVRKNSIKKKKNHSNICLDQKQMRQGKNIQSRWCRKTRAWPLGKNVICIWLSPSLINCGTICSKETSCVWGSGDKIYTRAMKPFRR